MCVVVVVVGVWVGEILQNRRRGERVEREVVVLERSGGEEVKGRWG